MIGSRILYCEISGNNVIWGDNPPLCESKYILSLEHRAAVLKLFGLGTPLCFQINIDTKELLFIWVMS